MTKLDDRKESIKKEIITDKINQCVGAELIGWEHQPMSKEDGVDYEEVILHFSNGSEISIYKVNGVVHVEGD